MQEISLYAGLEGQDTYQQRVLVDYDSFTLSPIINAPGTVQLTYPAKGKDCEWMVQQLDLEAEIKVRVQFDGVDQPKLTFWVETYDTDTLSESGQVQFTGRFRGAKLEEAIVHWQQSSTIPQGGQLAQGDFRYGYAGLPSNTPVYLTQSSYGQWVYNVRDNDPQIFLSIDGVIITGHHVEQINGKWYWNFSSTNTAHYDTTWKMRWVNGQQRGPAINLPPRTTDVPLRMELPGDPSDENVVGGWEMLYNDKQAHVAGKSEYFVINDFFSKDGYDPKTPLYQGGLRWGVERTFVNTTPGGLMIQLLKEAHDRGVLLDVVLDPRVTVDKTSDGENWRQRWGNDTTGATNESAYWLAPGMTYAKVLENLAKGHFCDWQFNAAGYLELHNPNVMGIDRTALDKTGSSSITKNTFRAARDLTEASRKRDITNTATDVYATSAIDDDSTMLQRIVSEPARTRKGRRVEAYAGELYFEGGDYSDLNRLLNDKMPDYLTSKYEVTIGVDYRNKDSLQPISDFDIGDVVYIDSNEMLERRRIVQWTVQVTSAGAIGGAVTLNDSFDPYILEVIADIETPKPPPTPTLAKVTKENLGRTWYFDNKQAGRMNSWLRIAEKTQTGASPNFEWEFSYINVPYSGFVVCTATGDYHEVELKGVAEKGENAKLPFTGIPKDTEKVEWQLKFRGEVLATGQETWKGKSTDPDGTQKHAIPMRAPFSAAASGSKWETVSIFFAGSYSVQKQHVDLIILPDAPGDFSLADPESLQIYSFSFAPLGVPSDSASRVAGAEDGDPTGWVYPTPQEYLGSTYDHTNAQEDYGLNSPAQIVAGNDQTPGYQNTGFCRWVGSTEAADMGNGTFNLYGPYSSVMTVELNGYWPAGTATVRYGLSGRKTFDS